MAPALESSVPQATISSTKRPRRLLPIIPAIPRILEKRPKPEEKPTTDVGVVIDHTPQESNGTLGEISKPLVEESKIEDTINPELIQSGDGSIQSSTEAESPGMCPLENIIALNAFLTWRTGSNETASNDSQNSLKNQPIANVSPTLQSEDFHLTPVPGDDAVGVQSDVVPASSEESLEVDKDPSPQEESSLHHHSLRATASSFHAHPTEVDVAEISPTLTTPEEIRLAQSISIPSQPISATEDGESSPDGLYNGRGHPQDMSFHPPPPPLSSDNHSSPTRSIYQGYSYDSGPAEFLTHAHPPAQYPHSFHPQLETFVPPEQQYVQYSPYHGHMPSFSALGNQAPLTPSATPLDAMPEPWKMPNRFSNALPDRDGPVAFQPHYRSDSHSTLRSDNFPSGGTGGVNGNTRPVQNGIYGSHAGEGSNIYDPPLNSPFERSSVVEHILRHFNDPNWADCEVVLIHEKRGFRKTRWYLSSILIIQSRPLQELLTSSKPAEDGKKTLKLRVNDRSVTPASMDYALRVLYGLSPDTFPAVSLDEDSAQTKSDLSIRSMKANLAFVASGRLLDLSSVVLRGLQNACEILTWDNLELALSFALQSENGRDGVASSSVAPTYSPSSARDSDPSSSSRVVYTPSSGSNHTPQQSHHRSSISQPETFPSPPPQFSNHLLPHCLDFIIYNFPRSFELDMTARPLVNLDRLPVTAESRSPLAKSRLSRIQFGGHPSEAAVKSKDRNVLVSSILFSIPFVQLQVLLARVGHPLASNMRSIIKEREHRRRIVVLSKSVPRSERMAASSREWTEAGYEESVEISNDGVTRISRKYTGIGSSSENDTKKQPAEKV